MKKTVLFTYIILFSLIFLVIESCKKDNSDQLEDDEYMNLPAEMMTLSAIAYVSDKYPDLIKDSIMHFLGDSSLATGGKWQLSWGPGISDQNKNLVYVVKNSSGDVPVYAIAIRGTNVHSIGDILEDFDVLKLTEFTYGEPGDSVCHGSMAGLTYILNSTDSLGGTTLEQHLVSITTNTKTQLFVTGHSQGGGLAPLLAYWLITHDQLKEKFTTSTYAFAGPGWVNKSFRDNFLNSLPEDASFNMMVNSLDMIPYGYANLPGIINNSIPVKVSSLYRLIIRTAQDSLDSRGITYYNIAIADTIGNIPVTTNPSGTHLLDSINWYDHWLKVEHNHNNYLKLLGAEPLN